MPDTTAARTRLETQLAELEDRLTRIAADLAEPLAADSSEQAVETEDDASLEGQAALVTREIGSVRRADSVATSFRRSRAGTGSPCHRRPFDARWPAETWPRPLTVSGGCIPSLVRSCMATIVGPHWDFAP